MRVPRKDLRVPDAEADIYLVGLGIGGFERRTVEAHNILSECGFIAHLTAFDDAIKVTYQADVYDLGVINASSDEPSMVYRQIAEVVIEAQDRKSTRLNSSHVSISYAVRCLRKI